MEAFAKKILNAARSKIYRPASAYALSRMRRFFAHEPISISVKHPFIGGVVLRGEYAFLPHEIAECLFFENHASPDSVIYDIGANVGKYAVAFSQHIGPGGSVIAFEASPFTAACLRDTIELNACSNIHVFEVALADRSGEGELISPIAQRGMATLDEQIGGRILSQFGLAGVQRECVNYETLDSLVEKHNIPLPNFIKIDVEGFEWQVLTGSSRTVLNARPLLYVEVHGVDSIEKEKNARQVLKWIFDHDYSVRHVECGVDIFSPSDQRAYRGHLFCTPNKQTQV